MVPSRPRRRLVVGDHRPPRTGTTEVSGVKPGLGRDRLRGACRSDMDDWERRRRGVATDRDLRVAAECLPVRRARLRRSAFKGGTSGLDRAPFRLLGTISYGVYLWHYPFLRAIGQGTLGSVLTGWSRLILVGCTALFATVVVAWVLYTTVESQMIRVGRDTGTFGALCSRWMHGRAKSRGPMPSIAPVSLARVAVAGALGELGEAESSHHN